MSKRRTEEELKAELVAAFPELEGKVRVARERRVWVEVELASFRKIFERAVKELGFSILCIITGLDEGENLGFIYHIADQGGTMLNIHTLAPKADPSIRTISDIFPAGHIYERELIDLFGAKVSGLAPGNRYPLPDGWPEGQYPLRKDFNPAVLDAGGEGA
jgi:Ni,Fe-hydrogenase III component G